MAKIENHEPDNFATHIVETIIFNVRWMLIPFYFGLIFVLGLYTYSYGAEIVHLLFTKPTAPSLMMYVILEMVDIVMVANLVKMIITGSYNSFVSKNHGYLYENISSGMLKVKMSTSIIGVSSIHLLQSFVNAKSIPMDDIMKQLMIHASFIVGAVMMIVIEYVHAKTESIEIENHRKMGHHKPTNTTETADH